jgi:hypothetical protein
MFLLASVWKIFMLFFCLCNLLNGPIDVFLFFQRQYRYYIWNCFVIFMLARICISNIISRGLCNVQWFEVRSDCLFWYWRNCWQSLIKISFQNKKEGEGERYTLNCLNFLFIMKKRNHAHLIINIILTFKKNFNGHIIF